MLFHSQPLTPVLWLRNVSNREDGKTAVADEIMGCPCGKWREGETEGEREGGGREGGGERGSAHMSRQVVRRMGMDAFTYMHIKGSKSFLNYVWFLGSS